MISYKILHTKDMNRNLFDHFIRHQTVVKCWRREHGSWIIRDDPFTDDWSEDDYRQLISHLNPCSAPMALSAVLLSEYFKRVCIGGCQMAWGIRRISRSDQPPCIGGYAENGNWKDALSCSRRMGKGKGAKSSICLLILQPKARPFTARSDVWMQGYTAGSMSKMNHMTVRWSMYYNCQIFHNICLQLRHARDTQTQKSRKRRLLS